MTQHQRAQLAEMSWLHFGVEFLLMCMILAFLILWAMFGTLMPMAFVVIFFALLTYLHNFHDKVEQAFINRCYNAE